MLVLVSLLVSLLGVGRAQPEVLESPQARAHFERAATLWQAGDYEGADAELAAAAAIEPTPALQYARGQLARERGDCEQAMVFYQQFLEHTEPNTRAREEVLMNMARCQAKLPAVAPSPTPAPPVVGSRPSAEPTTPPALRPRRMDPAAVGLVVAGSVTTAAAIGLGIAAGLEWQTAATTDVLDDFERHRRNSRIQLGTAAAAGSVGVTLLVVGLVRWVAHRRQLPRAAHRGPPGILRF